MARKFIKRLLPDPNWIKQQKSLQLLGSWVHDPNIWHLTRHSVARAAFIGLFMAFMPLPLQMVFAALLAIAFRVNMAIAVCLVWVTNPLTIGPIFYIAYKVGAAVMGTEYIPFEFELSGEWIRNGLIHIWQPFLLGCLLCGLFSGLLGMSFINWAWRQHTIRRWHDRRLKRQANEKK
jgi:uncharacterized protein (DUF2062 family)